MCVELLSAVIITIILTHFFLQLDFLHNMTSAADLVLLKAGTKDMQCEQVRVVTASW